jgi:hypothetical protein
MQVNQFYTFDLYWKKYISMLYKISLFSLQCMGDKILMDEFLLLPLTRKEFQDINKCRIYLQVLTLADIATGNGKQITNGTFIGRRRSRQVNVEKQKKLDL